MSWRWPPDRGHRRRRVRGNLRTRLFVLFGLVIILATALTFGVTHLVRRHLSDESAMLGGERFTQAQFARVWDDPVTRQNLAQDIATCFDVGITVFDTQGSVLLQAGDGAGPENLLEVRRGGELLGRVAFVGVPADARWTATVGLGIFLLLLWIAVGLIARQLIRPLEQLTEVARDIGAGRLDSRAALGHRGRGEIGVLANSLNDMAGRIQQQLADQRALLAAVSHELRTPLGHLRILLEMAEDAPDPRARLGEMSREIQEMDALVGELLASSRLDFSDLHRRDEDPLALAARALERKGLAPGLLKVGASVPEKIAVDATLLGRALANLLDNAHKHGGGVDELCVAADGGELRFEVADRGEGFDPAAREQLFAPFVDGGSERSALGLGLSLVRRIAEAHGGRAFARNRPEGGALFGLAVPLDATTHD